MTEEEIFAKTIYGEARGESLSGQEAIANVILNRAKNPCWWGKGIADICQKPKQFSCWNRSDKNYPLLQRDLSNDKVYQICLRIVKRALAGLLIDNTKGATHYHHYACSPFWARHLVPCAEIGHHLFYRLT